MSEFTGPKVCQHCGYYAQVRRRTVDQGWHVAEWGECRKADLAKTGVMTPENETCDDFTPDPRRWPHKLMDADLLPPESTMDALRRSMQRLVLHSSVTLFLGDCMEILPTLELGVIITDPPYGMKKAEWDEEIPNWLPLAGSAPVATFCGVVGMRDYPTPDWIGAWVRQGSTQRNGKLKGFNNWEPILFYNIPALKNDVIAVPNYHDDHGHPSVKPDKLMAKLMELMPPGAVVDPFMGTGTTGIAAIRARRPFVGIERDPKHFETARRRLQAELDADLFMQNVLLSDSRL